MTSAAYESLAAAFLRPWRAGITRALVDEAHERWGDYHEPGLGGFVKVGQWRNPTMRVQILDGALHFVDGVGSNEGSKRAKRQRAALRLLDTVLHHHKLPDVDFALSLNDRPTVPMSATKGRYPPCVFGYTHTASHHSVPFPPITFEPERWQQLWRSQHQLTSWLDRTRRAFFRGKCNSECDGETREAEACAAAHPELLHRAKLVREAARCPKLTDVALTSKNRFVCPGVVRSARVPMNEHAHHRIYIHVDGNGFSGRLDELLTLGGSILKQDSPYEVFYYPLLRRGVHYLPLARDFANLCSQLVTLQGDPAQGVALAAAASNFTNEFLAPGAVMGYVAAVIRQYASLQRFTPERHPMAKRWADNGNLTRPPTKKAVAKHHRVHPTKSAVDKHRRTRRVGRNNRVGRHTRGKGQKASSPASMPARREP